MSSTKPYLIRAIYDWCIDHDQTPYLVVWVDEHTRVPMEYVRDHEIVLSISQRASNNLEIENDWIHFGARFGGVAHDIWIPVGNIISIFSKETGEGMEFEIEKLVLSAPEAPETTIPIAREAETKPFIDKEDDIPDYLKILK